MTRRRVWSVALLGVSAVVLVLNRVFDLFAVPRGSDDANMAGALIQYVALAGVLLGVALVRRPTTAIRPAGRVQRPARVLLILGVVAVASYLVLGALGTGIGAPTDIGGGLIPIAGYVLTGVGIFKAVDNHYYPAGTPHP